MCSPKDGDWGTLTVQRPNSQAISVAYINRVLEINFRGPGNTNNNIDGYDRDTGTIIEGKSAGGLSNPMADPVAVWAHQHIFNKTAARIDQLQVATGTFGNTNPPYVGPSQLPSVDELKAVRKYVFEIQSLSTIPGLQQAVNAEIQNLTNKYPGYQFSAVDSGNSPPP